VEQKMDPLKGCNKRPAVSMFEKEDGKSTSLKNKNSLKMDFLNYNQDKHSLIDKN
jgi:hypothetical protein